MILETTIAYDTGTKVVIRGPEDAHKAMINELAMKKQEHFYVMVVDTKNVVISSNLVFKGSLNATAVHPREILKPAITVSGASILMIHNHPTGDPTPSREDVAFTKRMSKCCDIMGIPLLDHIIIGTGFYSFRGETEILS